MSDLSGAKFIGTNLEKAEFIRCVLISTNFSKANLKDTLFENNNESRVQR